MNLKLNLLAVLLITSWSAFAFDRILITDRLVRPWDMVFLDNKTALISEKEGGIQKVDLGTGKKAEVTGLPKDLDNRNQTGLGDNSGLFGLALHPKFSQQPWLYFAYAAKDPQGRGATTKIARAKYADGYLSNLQSLFVAEPYTQDRYHYGGGLIFGADKKLYFTVGERLFNEKDQPDMPIAQNLSDRRGKIYRLNPDGSIPADNPRFTEEAAAGLYAIGIRAAQGLAVNPLTKQIWFSEHGTRQGDELNVLKGAANYGWPIKTTGDYRFREYQPPKLSERTFTAPVWFWQNTVAPTGLTFYRGEEFPEWEDNLLVAGLSKGNLWRFKIQNNQIVEAEELMKQQRIRLRNIKQAPDGKLYVLTDEANGRLLRLTPNQ